MFGGYDSCGNPAQLNSEAAPQGSGGRQGTSWVAVSPATPGERVERALAKHGEAPEVCKQGY